MITKKLNTEVIPLAVEVAKLLGVKPEKVMVRKGPTEIEVLVDGKEVPLDKQADVKTWADALLKG